MVGLGNPGSRYAATRHNAGRRALEELASRTPGTQFSTHRRSNAETADCRPIPGGAALVLAQPRSFMNLSGGPVRALADYYRILPRRLIVLYDDLELPLGEVATREPGSGDRGHKGLKSISASLGTRDYHRVALGIGRPPGRMPVADFVLRPFNKVEQRKLPIMLADAADAVERLAGLRG